jgi:hypothetical protein
MTKKVVDGDTVYTDDINQIIDALQQNGVIDGFAVSTSSGLTVSIASGNAYVNGKKVSRDTSQTVTLSDADASLDRIDLIVLDENGDASAIEGTPLTNPVPAPFSATKVVLAYVTVSAGASSLSSSDITDERIIVKHQIYKMPWLSEVETGGDVQLFDDNNTSTESDWSRIVDPDYDFDETASEIVIQNGLLRIKSRHMEASGKGKFDLYVVEDRDYDDDDLCEYINILNFHIGSNIDGGYWNISEVVPTVTFAQISPNKVKVKFSYSDSNRVIDIYICMKRGERFVEVTSNVNTLASGDTQLTCLLISGDRNAVFDSRFFYRDISTGGKFYDANIETATKTGDGDNLYKNYEMIYGDDETNPYIFGFASDKKPSDNSYGSRAEYSSNQWSVMFMSETGLTVSSGDIGIKFYLFAIPFPKISHLVKEGEVGSDGDEFGRTAVSGTWISVANANRSGGNYLTNDDGEGGSSSVNDEIRYDFYVPRDGYYDAWVAGYEGPSMGISDVEVDNVSQGTIDWYAVSGTWTYGSVENISLTKGRHDIDLLMSAKNGSSSDYEMSIDAIYLVPKFEETSYTGDFPYDIARQAISDNDFSYGYTSPLNYEGFLDTDDVTNDWSFGSKMVAILPVGTDSSSETVDFYRNARKRYIDDIISREAETGYHAVTGTWSTESGYGDDSSDSISCPRNGGEVKWYLDFPRKGWYLSSLKVRESDDNTDDKYQYSLKNVSISEAYTSLSNNHLHDKDSSDSTIRWSDAEGFFYALQGSQTIQVKCENTGDDKVIDKIEIYPVDPVPVIGSPSTPSAITFTTKLISDVPHSRIDGINQMDSIQAKRGNFNYVDMSGDIDINQSEVKELVLENLSSAPSSPVAGQIYFDTSGSKFYGYNGSTWSEL